MIKTVPCEICGRPSSPIDRRCENCWEVERRLASYIETPAGRAWVDMMLNPPTAEPAMPMIEVDTEGMKEAIREVIAGQGWNDETVGILAGEFIAEAGLNARFYYFLKQHR